MEFTPITLKIGAPNQFHTRKKKQKTVKCLKEDSQEATQIFPLALPSRSCVIFFFPKTLLSTKISKLKLPTSQHRGDLNLDGKSVPGTHIRISCRGRDASAYMQTVKRESWAGAVECSSQMTRRKCPAPVSCGEPSV